jgi:signal transduction histidine kinase
MSSILLVTSDNGTRAEVLGLFRGQDTVGVLPVANSAEALTALTKTAFGLVLVEDAWPDFDGFGFYEKIREEDAGQSVVVLLPPGKVVGRRRCRADLADVMTLPLDSARLIERARSLVRGNIRVRESIPIASELTGELRIGRDALRETFDFFQDGLLLLDATGKILVENEAAKAMLSRASDGASTTPMGDAHAPSMEIQQAIIHLAREAITGNVTTTRTFMWQNRQLEARANSATFDRALVCLRDVTEERDREIHRLQAEKLASIGMLAAGVAHEINNPASFVVANIDSLASLLRKLDDRLRGEFGYVRGSGIPEALFEAMTMVQESKEGMARIHRIARDLHSFSRVDDDRHALSDVNSALDSALTMLRSELRYRTTVDRELRATQMVRASAARLGQVFLNLILNAAHALADLPSKRNRLCVRSRDDGEKVTVEVEDNGPGIPPEIMPRIFESFFTTKPPGIGTGLGLPISLDIIRRLGGELTAQSKPGRGALFRVQLPAAKVAKTTRSKSIEYPKATCRRRILAIDDEALLLKAYQRMLSNHHDIEIKLGGREALRLFGQDRAFDVVLCDLQMPEMSGIELFATVQQQWPDLAAKFIFITGGAFSPEARQFLENPAVICINKPFQIRELMDLIDARLG